MSDHLTNASFPAEKPEQVTKPAMSLGEIIAQSKAASDEKRRQRQARQLKAGGEKRSLPQPEGEESGAVGERSSAVSSEVVKRPRIEALNMSDVGILRSDKNMRALVHKDDPSNMDFVARGGFTSSMGTARTAEDFATAMRGVVEDNLRNNNGSFQGVSWLVKKQTKRDRELAHRVYQRRRIPLELQYEQEQERRRAIEQGAAAGNTAQPAAGGVPASGCAPAAPAATPAATEGGKKPVVYKTGVGRKGMDRDELDAEMEEWRRDNNIGADK